MLNSVLIDAGPLIALFDSSEKHHKGVRAFLKAHPYRYVSTLAVFTEVSHMLDFSAKAQRDFYEWVMYKGVVISDINQNDMPRLLELTNKYADLPMDCMRRVHTPPVRAKKKGMYPETNTLPKQPYPVRYAAGLVDFADATLVITAEKTSIREIISLDNDFDIYRLPGKEHIRNVFRT